MNAHKLISRFLTGASAGIITMSAVWTLFRTDYSWQSVAGLIAWLTFYVATTMTASKMKQGVGGS